MPNGCYPVIQGDTEYRALRQQERVDTGYNSGKKKASNH